eukprot:365596-Chlamydomonas_euryale.AAC.33
MPRSSPSRRHLNKHQVRAVLAGSQHERVVGAVRLGSRYDLGAVARAQCLAVGAQRPLNHDHVHLAISAKANMQLLAGVKLRNIYVGILVQLDALGRVHVPPRRRFAGPAQDVQQSVVAVRLAVHAAAVLWLVAAPVGRQPHLQEAARGIAVVHLRVHDALASRHVLHAAAPQRLLVAHRILVRELAVDDI